MSDDTERLEAQVDKLTRERDDAYQALEVAGVKARELRQELDRAYQALRDLAEPRKAA